jgi:hypothetical protein
MKRTAAGETDASPHVPLGQTGLVIAATLAGADLAIHGAYRLLVADADRLGPPPAQRAVVIAAQAGRRAHAFAAWGDQVIFADDEDRGPGSVEGYFQVDLGARFALHAGEVCYVVASMGPILSNVLSFSMPKGSGP